MRVLIVEDTSVIGDLLCRLISSLGHQWRWAVDGRDAIQVAADFNPDIILLDIGLPDMDGYEVASQLRADQRFVHTRIVAVSAYEADLPRALNAGIDDYLRKPLAVTTLSNVLNATKTSCSATSLSAPQIA